ncbi:MAG: DNA polymerase IV [Candidatus Aenigmarchaeota archaeon]|nr:DNA polymerase IV [Candidatus Aenigmarchaeota archaeon]
MKNNYFSMSRVVMHVDLNYFFAQCEEIKNPSLIGKPVIVCVYSGRTEDSGAVASANYLARESGVKAGMPIVFAKRIMKDKEVYFLPPDRELYSQTSNRVMEILGKHADILEVRSIDEAYLDVTKRTDGDFDNAVKLATDIKKELRLKEKLICSIGIGPNKLVAKISSGFKKPDGLTAVKPKEVKKFLNPLKVTDIPGVGKKSEEKMKELGVNTIEDLSKVGLQKLKGMFGNKTGEYFFDAANGIDEEPVEIRSDNVQMSKIETLKEDSRDFNLISEVTDKLCVEVAQRAKEEKTLFKNIGIIAFMKNLESRSKSRTIESYTNDAKIVKKVSRELLREFLHNVDIDVRRIGVRIGSFERKKEGSLSKFMKK